MNSCQLALESLNFFIIKSLKIIAMRVSYLWILIIDPKLSIKRQSCWTWMTKMLLGNNQFWLSLPAHSRLNCIWMSSNTKKPQNLFNIYFFKFDWRCLPHLDKSRLFFKQHETKKKYSISSSSFHMSQLLIIRFSIFLTFFDVP